MKEFIIALLVFWGFIVSITGIFCISNMKIAGRVMRRTLKKFSLIGLCVSCVLLLSVFVDFMPTMKEMFALAIISSCWLIDLLNKERAKLDPNHNYGKFYIHDIFWVISMSAMVLWYCAYIFTSDFGLILTTIKTIILMATIVVSSFGSQKLLESTL